MKIKQKLCQNKDIFERMNYLYQASHLMASINRVAASYYGNNMAGCARKLVLRIEPGLKRTICKCCQSPLIPGKTARVRLISKPIKCVKWTCLTCINTKRFPTKKGYKLWLDQPKAILETLNYTKSKDENIHEPNITDSSEKAEDQHKS